MAQTDRYIAPGTRVQLGTPSGNEEPECGIVILCWLDAEHDFYDCYVAFFGNEFPTEQPDKVPYVLRYAAITLNVLD